MSIVLYRGVNKKLTRRMRGHSMMHTEVSEHLIECNAGHISDKVSGTH